MAEIKDLFDRQAKIVGDLVGKFKAGRVLAHLNACDGLAGDTDGVGKFLLAHLAGLAQFGNFSLHAAQPPSAAQAGMDQT